MSRLALGVEYDGAGFQGWQCQPHGRTVQDVLEAALAQFAGAPLPTICAGRTDSGVHALDQVVHVDPACERELVSWVRGVNRYLPPTVAVRWARAVPGTFHARHDARARRYDYRILNDRARAPLLAGRVAWVFRPLDVAAMDLAARQLVGTHDFSAFRSAECQAPSPVRTVLDCSVTAQAEGVVRFTICAHAFLHHMVRNIAGALIEIGLGRQPVAWMGQLLAERDRRRAAATADAAGLVLARVHYDPALGLPVPRVQATASAQATEGPQATQEAQANEALPAPFGFEPAA
jgi:tRNA pseudouridine38-40 synthase